VSNQFLQKEAACETVNGYQLYKVRATSRW